MESRKHQESNNPIKIVAKIIALASFFSIVLSYSSLISFFQRKPNLSVHSSFSTCFIHKNCMFLLCNGILGLIFKNSGLIGNNDVHREKKVVEIEENRVEPKELSARKLVVEDKVEEEEEVEDGLVVEAEDEDNIFNEHDGEDEEQEGFKILMFDHADDAGAAAYDDYDVDDDEGNGSLSTEDLNKKCEDFIRKMREGIKFESNS